MKTFDQKKLQKLYRPPKDSHKGQNGRLLVIGGSRLFHASPFWSADVASRIVDLVHFSSPEAHNNELVRKKLKEGFWNGIVVPWERVETYIQEDDCILIGPGMPRESGEEVGDVDTGEVTNTLLTTYPDKRWVIDGGALQEMALEAIPQGAILTPHQGEFERLWAKIKNARPERSRRGKLKIENSDDRVEWFAKEYDCVVLLKGKVDLICGEGECVQIKGGNEGMTKGGTGDVLAGIVAALYCKNPAFLSATAASFLNKKAGERLYQAMGPHFNASDLAVAVSMTMKRLLG